MLSESMVSYRQIARINMKYKKELQVVVFGGLGRKLNWILSMRPRSLGDAVKKCKLTEINGKCR